MFPSYTNSFRAAAKVLLFGTIALALLALGCVVAQFLSFVTRHRYDLPNSGYYYGSVNANFSDPDNYRYSFRFQGKSEPHWQWVHSPNFVYPSLQFSWHSNDRQAGRTEGSGTLKLPSLAYESSHGAGILTSEVLAQWLLGSAQRTPRAEWRVDVIYSFMEAAGRGDLPPPRHHPHHFREPVDGHIQHAVLGLGVGVFVYIWSCIWLFLLVFYGPRLWRRLNGAQ